MDRTVLKLFLPDGVWYDFINGKRYVGGKRYTTFYKEEDYPVFAKAGTIIPLAILDRNDVDLVIQLERWVPSREYTRVGVEENDISEDVLGIKIPKIVVPVSSGRSMSVIIEAAVMNMRLRDVGIDSSKEFVERILKNIDHNKQEQ